MYNNKPVYYDSLMKRIEEVKKQKDKMENKYLLWRMSPEIVFNP